jgi:hypothetical protein
MDEEEELRRPKKSSSFFKKPFNSLKSKVIVVDLFVGV